MIIDNYFNIKPTFLETVGLQSQNMNRILAYNELEKHVKVALA